MTSTGGWHSYVFTIESLRPKYCSGLALGTVEVRLGALRTRSHPSTQALKMVPKAQPWSHHQDGCLRGLYCLGRDSHASALAV